MKRINGQGRGQIDYAIEDVSTPIQVKQRQIIQLGKKKIFAHIGPDTHIAAAECCDKEKTRLAKN